MRLAVQEQILTLQAQQSPVQKSASAADAGIERQRGAFFCAPRIAEHGNFNLTTKKG
jgi:hypothetical protein